MEDIFDSAVRSAEDLAGVLECDSETSYFYLYKTNEDQGSCVLDSIRIGIGAPEFTLEDIKIEWDAGETIVSLIIKGIVWAAFNTETGTKYGGNYKENSQPEIPQEVIEKF